MSQPDGMSLLRPSTMFSNFTAYTTTTQLVVSLASLLLVYGIYKILAFVYDELTSPLRHVPGPPNPSFIYGNFKQLSESVSRKDHIVSLLTVNGYIPNRIIPRWRRVGSIYTDRQSNSEWYSVWVDYRVPRDLTPQFSQSQFVLWPPISKQPITCFSIVMTIRNPRWPSVLLACSSEVVRFD